MKKNKRSEKKVSAAASLNQSTQKQNRSDSTPKVRLLRENSIWFVYLSRLFFFLFVFWFWAFRYGNFLYMSQNYDIFLWDFDFLGQNISRLNGLLAWFSSFVIQFFYYPILGGFILAVCLSTTQIFIASFFRLKRSFELFSFIPPLLLMIAATKVNYYFFEAFDLSFLFSLIFSLFYLFGIACLFQRIAQPKKRLTFSLLTTFVFYPVFGFFALFAAILCLLKEWTYSYDSKRNFRCEMIFLSILISPICWFPVFSSSNSFFWFFISGLLEENVFDKDLVTKVLFYGTLYATLFLILFWALCETVFVKFVSKSKIFDLNHSKTFNSLEKNASSEESPQKCEKINCRWGIRESILSIILILFCWETVHEAFYPQDFKVLLQMGKLLEERRWNEIIELESTIANSSNPILSLRTLALIKTDQFADRFFERPYIPKSSDQLMLVSSFKMLGDRILLEHGYFNLATRTAMNNFADKNERSLWATKTLALSAVAQNEVALAEKYLKRLEKTLFHRDWARRYLEYLHQKNIPSEKQTDLARTAAEEIRAISETAIQEDYTSNVLALDYVVYLGYQDQDFSKRSRQQQANQLTVQLILMNMDVFFDQLNVYLQNRGDAPIPEYFQQAILFDSYFLKKKRVDPDLCPISPDIQRRFTEFVAISSDIKRNPKYEKEGIKKLDQDFSDTFWYHEIFTKELVYY